MKICFVFRNNKIDIEKLFMVCYNKGMEEFVRSLEDSVILENCMITVLPEMLANPDKPFFKIIRERIAGEYSKFAMAVREAAVVGLVKEVLVLINQVWKNDPKNYDEGLIHERNVFNKVKRNISKDGKSLPFNTRELYKRLREAVAHNDINNPNIQYKFTHFEINLGEVNGADYIIEINPKELAELLAVLISNRTTNGRQEISFARQEVNTREDIYNYVKVIDSKTGDLISLDENQIDRAYEFFTYLAPSRKLEDNLSNIRYAVALPGNPENLLYDKLQTLHMVALMNSGSTFNQLSQFIETLDCNAGKISIYFAIVTNILFEIASSQTVEQFAEMLKIAGLNLTDDQVRHFRNALCHGRYFHDFRRTFFFYDGRKDLNLEVKIDVDDINKIIDVLAKCKKKVLLF